jgi:hypothetical protein
LKKSKKYGGFVNKNGSMERWNSGMMGYWGVGE